MDGTLRSEIQRRVKVAIVLKKNQRTGLLSNGTVKGHSDCSSTTSAWNRSPSGKRRDRTGKENSP